MSRWITRALDSRESVPVFQVSKYTKKLPSRGSTLCNSMDWSPPGSSVRGIFQARVWSGSPCPRPGDLPDPGIEPVSFMFPEWAGRFSIASTAWGSLVAQTVNNMPAVGDTWVWSLPGLGRSLEERNGYPLQYSCPESSMNRGAWWATVHEVTKSQTRLSNFQFRSTIKMPSFIRENNTAPKSVTRIPFYAQTW